MINIIFKTSPMHPDFSANHSYKRCREDVDNSFSSKPMEVVDSLYNSMSVRAVLFYVQNLNYTAHIFKMYERKYEPRSLTTSFFESL